MDRRVIGARLRRLREETGLSQGAFARRLGLSGEYISLLEAAKRTPSFATLNKIAAFLHKDISVFFEEHENAFLLLLRGEGLDDRSRSELMRFRRYCEEYLKLEEITGRRLPLAPHYAPVAAERMADEERRRLGLGDEPIRDIFSLMEMNGCRVLRQPLPAECKVSGAFIFLEARQAAFAMINSAQSAGRQAFSAAHEYCHYLRDRADGPVIENPDVFIDELVSLYPPREQYAQQFAARFLMPPGKVREIVDKDMAGKRLAYEDVLYLKRYFGVSAVAMLRTLRDAGYLSREQFERFYKADHDRREKELFGTTAEEATGAKGGMLGLSRKRAVASDRFRLLAQEALKKPAPAASSAAAKGAR
jgi:Zn-dependent peptidase ImmA (M78 family)/DNA-binding XRE family transcriptional regulator